MSSVCVCALCKSKLFVPICLIEHTTGSGIDRHGLCRKIWMLGVLSEERQRRGAGTQTSSSFLGGRGWGKGALR